MGSRWLLAGGALLGIGLVAAVEGVFQYTTSQTFCTSCHVMDGIHQEWAESPHGRNALGIEVTCAQCHIAPGRIAEARAKVRAIHAELIPWLSGVRTPKQIEEKRLVLAQRVWKHLRETDSSSCRSCHRMNEADLALQTTRARAEHQDAAQQGQTCIECHDKGVAHHRVEKPEPKGKDEWNNNDFNL